MTSRFQPPPIIKAAERLLDEIEKAVRQFPRYHRYAVGADLRRQAMTVNINANRTWRDRDHQAALVGQLVWDVDALKQYLQAAMRLRAFNSFRRFEMLARLAHELGAQAGGWNRRFSTPNAQNARANGVPQRGEKLSTRTAPARANS